MGSLVASLVATVAVVGWISSLRLPDSLPAPQASVLYYSDGSTELARIGATDRTDVPLEQVPEPLRRAVLAAEDRAFFQHDGVSLRGVARAARDNLLRGGGAGGASTITQQYVRNAFLSQVFSTRRKVVELGLAIKIERKMSKEQILERYLNLIYFGRGAYGVDAAARAYFGIPVDRLDQAQSLLIAAVIKDPTNFDPAVDPAAAQQRWTFLRSVMVDQGWLSPASAAALGFPATADPASSGQSLAGPNGHIVDQVERELKQRGIAPAVLRSAGLKVVTTIDVRTQRAAVDAVGQVLGGQPEQLRTALVAIAPGSGAVRAYYGGRRGSGFFDDATAPRQPGATFTPIVLASALRSGIDPLTTRWDGRSPRLFPDRFGVPLYNPDNIQCPNCTLTEALAADLNTPLYDLATRVGAGRVAEIARDLGIPATYQGRPSLTDGPGQPKEGRTRAEIALGRYPVAPVDLAATYAVLAADGTRADRHFVTSVSQPNSDTNWQLTPVQTRQVLPAKSARLLRALIARGQSRAYPAGPEILAPGRPGTARWTTNPATPDQPTPERPTLDRPALDRPALDRAGPAAPGQQAPGQVTSGPSGAASAGSGPETAQLAPEVNSSSPPPGGQPSGSSATGRSSAPADPPSARAGRSGSSADSAAQRANADGQPSATPSPDEGVQLAADDGSRPVPLVDWLKAFGFKTSTVRYGDTADSQDAWLAGWSSDLAMVAWVGQEKSGPLRDAQGQSITGDTLPVDLWATFARAIA